MGNRIRKLIRIETGTLSSRAVLIFVLLGTFSIVCIGLTRAIPRFAAFYIYAWFFALIFNVLSAWAIRRKFGTLSPRRYLASFFLALVIFYYLGTIIGSGSIYESYESRSGWNGFHISRDSASYVEEWGPLSFRPPVYPFFIELVTVGTGFSHTTQGYPIHILCDDSDSPFLKIARIQRILVIGLSLIVCVILMSMLNSPLPALFFAGLYDFGFFALFSNSILTESLAEVWLFLIIAAFFTFLWKGWKILLPLTGIFCAALYLTRPAGAYGGVFLMALIGCALYSNWRKYWLLSLSTIFLTAALVAIPIMYSYSATGVLQPAQLYVTEKLAFALQFAKEEDVPLMPDEESRMFLKRALEKKQIEDMRIESEYSEKWEQNIAMLAANLNPVTFNDVGGCWIGYVNPRIWKIAKIILGRHRLEYLKFGWSIFGDSVIHISRLNRIGPPVISWAILIISIMLLLCSRGWVRFSSIVLILAHYTSLAIAAFNSAPQARYVYATEFLLVMAIFILGCSFFDNIIRKN